MIDDLLGDVIEHDVALGPLTTYRVGGRARWFAVIDDDATLARVADAVHRAGVDVLVVGKGSNLLVADAGFDGLAVQLGPTFTQIDIDGVTVRAGGASNNAERFANSISARSKAARSRYFKSGLSTRDHWRRQ